MKRPTILICILTALAASTTYAQSSRKSCKQVDSCEEAVEIWCEGYRRADADKDDIPCENICHTREQVEEIRSRIGC